METGNGLPKPVTASAMKNSLSSDFSAWLRHLRRLEKDSQLSLNDDQASHETGFRTRRASPHTDISESDVMEVLHIHERYRLPSLVEDTEVTDLPNFEDVTPYEVTKEQQKILWEKEVSRLVAVVRSDSPLVFEGSPDLKADSKRSYELLTNLAAQVWLAECIVTYDAQSMFAEHHKPLCYSSLLRRSRSTIDYVCNKDDEDDDKEDVQDEMAPRASRIDVVSFINYVTAVFVRNFCMATEGKNLHAKIIANLARISTKLKVVTTKPLEFCQRSIANGAADRGTVDLPSHYGTRGRQTGIINELSQDSGPMPELINPMLARLRAMDPERGDNPDRTSKKDSLRTMYFFNCSKHQAMIHEMLGFVLLSLRGGNQLTSASISSYEMTAIVFKTGFGNLPALIFQDRDNDFLGTSDASNINCARAAFHNLDQTIKMIQSQAGQSTTSSTETGTLVPVEPTERTTDQAGENESVGTCISWAFETDALDKESLRTPSRLRLSSMIKVISVIVPLLFANPIAVCICERFISMCIFAELTEERRLHPIKHSDFDRYLAFFSLSTREYNDSRSGSQPYEAKSLSHALIRQKTLLSRKQDDKEQVASGQLVDTSHDSRLIEQFKMSSPI